MPWTLELLASDSSETALGIFLADARLPAKTMPTPQTCGSVHLLEKAPVMFIPPMSVENISRAYSMAAWANQLEEARQAQQAQQLAPPPGSESRYALRPSWRTPAFVRSATQISGQINPNQAAWQKLEACGWSALVKTQGAPTGRQLLSFPSLETLASLNAPLGLRWVATKGLDGSMTIAAVNSEQLQLPVFRMMANSSPGQPPYFWLDGRPVDRNNPIWDLQIAAELVHGLEFML
ncbi:hypothetical protein ACSFA3_14880 [Variovorax sp. RHLX14]|uniref:hypothetical protein n=1 Tax=Variovorax sp. RHLX14 TaxID=1259731 RepID=UPI003F46C9B3